MSAKKLLLDALLKKYNAQISDATSKIFIYLHSPVAIGEHPQFLEELDKVLNQISSAEENLKTLSKYFDKINDDDIPF